VLDVFVYGPDIDYPSHAHPAEEVYLVLGGTAWFRTGREAEYHPLRAGDLSHHSPDLPHAIRIGDEPVLGVVMYRGDLEGPLWYRSDMYDETEEKKYPGVIRPE
jgi:quercetin dioxygenase-like cupin family protein